MPLVQDTLFGNPERVPTRRGVPWHQQELTEPPLDVLRRVRQAIYDGRFSRAELDHNHSRYSSGLSNKQIKILGAWLLGWDTNAPKGPTYDQCFDAVMEAVVGTRPSTNNR